MLGVQGSDDLDLCNETLVAAEEHAAAGNTMLMEFDNNLDEQLNSNVASKAHLVLVLSTPRLHSLLLVGASAISASTNVHSPWNFHYHCSQCERMPL